VFRNRFGARRSTLPDARACLLRSPPQQPPPRARTAVQSPGDDIATDRPDVTNSSIVVPVGSLQNENGSNLTGRDGGRSIDGSNSRWRARHRALPRGAGRLAELSRNNEIARSIRLFRRRGPASNGRSAQCRGRSTSRSRPASHCRPARVDVAGRGTQPYIQLPWSWELHDGWGVSGMFTEFFRPSELTGRQMSEATFVIEKKLTARISVFTEYVGDYPDGARPTQLINSGGMVQITPTQQVDLHVAFGLNRNSPNTIVGLGYSFRVDGLFR
jgi:hypothetical protein